MSKKNHSLTEKGGKPTDYFRGRTTTERTRTREQEGEHGVERERGKRDRREVFL